ncbi:helix-turn-helix transcriptional regulator [Cyclobacterium jeungdonense]|uniref:Helix-turn-helix transcriptional regulator n=1 Tax=Cyclobacterium jeungdonense TaxID=708087 RepID=A0ABT8C973_9BACT|nr:helix-turn-helix transcriptional regulator [Cyclobacterium jeungdonense]MDN3689060.1 helix-turn-helix transcriptional regulator [Cyclobacterium jeungdonense]
MAKNLNKEMVKKETDRFNRDVSLNLKRLREERNFTQEYMAECIGKDYSSGYATLEQGKKKLSFEDAVKISECLNVPLMRILNPSFDPSKENVSEEERPLYGKPKKSSMQISVTLTGDFGDLQKQIRLLEKVNEILANDSV